MEEKQTVSAESFVSSVFKFSISTYINFLVYGLAILITGLFIPPEVSGPVALFINISTLVMNVAILGLDQSFIRFFNEPPANLSKKNLFGVCFSISCVFLLLIGILGSVLFPSQISAALGLSEQMEYVPLLFINAFLLLVARYFNVAYRMEQNIRLFTLESVLMQFFSRLFYLVGAFLANPILGMVLCCILGTFGFILVFTYLRKGQILPDMGSFTRPVLGTLLPYGLALAPTAVLLYLNTTFSMVYVNRTLGDYAQGIFSFSVTLSNIVTVVQAGFATFWGAFMYANYKTEQAKICKVHDFLNFIILVFFACLILFEDVLFFILPQYRTGLATFPLMMLAAVFTILSEGTVYGISIARKPIFDTIGIGLSLVSNVLLCLLLVPHYALLGAAASLALSSFVMFLFRTLVAQQFYRTVTYPQKTAFALGLGILNAIVGCVFSTSFALKALACIALIAVYCLLYKRELLRTLHLTRDILLAVKNMLHRKKNA